MARKNEREQIYVTEEAFEVRYEPRGTFLNEIGVIADYIKDKGLFPHWQIESNKITFRDRAGGAEHLSAFMSFKNAGLIAVDAPTRNFFSDKAVQYWKLVETNPHFKIPEIRRIGVRNRCFARIDKEFTTIEKALFDFFYRSDNARFLGGTRKDHQVVLFTENGETSTRAQFAPMRRDEASRIFQFPSEHFSRAGIFIDLDSYVENPKEGVRGVEDFLKTVSASAWDRIETLVAAIGV